MGSITFLPQINHVCLLSRTPLGQVFLGFKNLVEKHLCMLYFCLADKTHCKLQTPGAEDAFRVQSWLLFFLLYIWVCCLKCCTGYIRVKALKGTWREFQKFHHVIHGLYQGESTENNLEGVTKNPIRALAKLPFWRNSWNPFFLSLRMSSRKTLFCKGT